MTTRQHGHFDETIMEPLKKQKGEAGGEAGRRTSRKSKLSGCRINGADVTD